jgi:PKD repeat protein
MRATASTDPDGNSTIRTYHWDFGDGSTDVGPIVLHSYLAPDTYTVRLTVTDSGGLSDVAETEAAISFPENESIQPHKSLELVPSSGALLARVHLTLLPPEMLISEPRVRAVVVDPNGVTYDSGIVASHEYMREFANPINGTWQLTAFFYTVRRDDPQAQPEIVAREVENRGVGPVMPPPLITGDYYEIWWLRGGFDGLHPTSVVLTAHTVGACQWFIRDGLSRVNITPNGCSVLVRSIGSSHFWDDVSIMVRSNGVYSSPFYMTVREPKELDFIGEFTVPHYDGYWTSLTYNVLDNLYSLVQRGRIPERRSGRQSQTPNNWQDPVESTFTINSGQLTDNMAAWGVAKIPRPVPPNHPDADERVMSYLQRLLFEVGPVHTLQLKQHTQQFYRGKGAHE